jgi:hypothetical protein
VVFNIKSVGNTSIRKWENCLVGPVDQIFPKKSYLLVGTGVKCIINFIQLKNDAVLCKMISEACTNGKTELERNLLDLRFPER